MKYALIQVLPDVPSGGVCAGIDWAAEDHVACAVDMPGGCVPGSAPRMTRTASAS
jgi:hypothetical protein